MKQREQALILLEKARHDEVLVEEVLNSERVSDDMIGFHCQQALDKILKALLSLHGIRFRKTHDLREIVDLLSDAGHPVPNDLQDIDILNPYAHLFFATRQCPTRHLWTAMRPWRWCAARENGSRVRLTEQPTTGYRLPV
ncbi:MAG: HEPN domain-containing protein [Planctomycetota bacterium]|nr:HEPN domain-containing protein [Planctomycetota bacterium]